MRQLNVRQALGGRSAASARSWLILAVPSTLLVVVQESNSNFDAWWITLVSAFAQHAAVGLLLLAVPLLRRRWPVLPLDLLIPLWVAVGVVRGLVSGLFAENFATIDPQYGYRMLSWIGVSLVWTPLFTYALAQYEHRRDLLDEFTLVAASLEDARVRAAETSGELHSRLVKAIRRSVAPVIDEIQASLARVAQGIGTDSFATISERLALVSTDVSRLVDARLVRIAVPSTKAARPSLIAASRFSHSRPLVVSILTIVTIAVVTIPDALVVGHPKIAIETAIALGVALLVLWGGLAATAHWRSDDANRNNALVYGSYLVAGLAATSTLIAVPVSMSGPHEMALRFALPLGIIFGAASLSAAIGLEAANRELIAQTSTLRDETVFLELASTETETRVRENLSIVLHGPVLGRLSACVMALNFHASATIRPTADATAATTGHVIDHLALAAHDLELISET